MSAGSQQHGGHSLCISCSVAVCPKKLSRRDALPADDPGQL
jgi:hypothetical protein